MIELKSGMVLELNNGKMVTVMEKNGKPIVVNSVDPMRWDTEIPQESEIKAVYEWNKDTFNFHPVEHRNWLTKVWAPKVVPPMDTKVLVRCSDAVPWIPRVSSGKVDEFGRLVCFDGGADSGMAQCTTSWEQWREFDLSVLYPKGAKVLVYAGEGLGWTEAVSLGTTTDGKLSCSLFSGVCILADRAMPYDKYNAERLK